MNSIFLLFVLTTLCVIQFSSSTSIYKPDDMEYLEAHLKNNKARVESAIVSVNHFKSDLQFDFDSKLVLRQNFESRVISRLINTMLVEIRTLVDNSPAGKNAEQCYENARVGLRSASLDSFSDMDLCTKNAKYIIIQNINTINFVELTGQTLLKELDRIFPGCYSVNDYIMRHCITKKLTKADASVKNLEATADSVKNSGEASSKSAILSGAQCYREVTEKIKLKIPSFKIDAENCISRS